MPASMRSTVRLGVAGWAYNGAEGMPSLYASDVRSCSGAPASRLGDFLPERGSRHALQHRGDDRGTGDDDRESPANLAGVVKDVIADDRHERWADAHAGHVHDEEVE